MKVPFPPAPSPGPAMVERGARRAGLAVFALLVLVGLVLPSRDSSAGLMIGAVIALAGGALSFLRVSRAEPVYVAMATIGVVILGNGDSADICWFAVVIMAAWWALLVKPVLAAAYCGGCVLIFVSEWAFVFRDLGWVPWAAGVVAGTLAVVAIRHQLVLMDRLRAAQAGLAERSRDEERARIARELHDVIAHSLTVTLLHVSSARMAIEHDPADAARALAEAERLGRQSLAEVRATMGILRPGSPGGPASPGRPAPPVPGLADIPALVSELRGTGAQIELSTQGDPTAVPATLGATVYRVVQEALTNAARHAPGHPALVAIAVTARQLSAAVDSAGPPGRGSGMGLVNMAERAAAVGGVCSAGPGGRGWQVRLTIPLRDTPAVIADPAHGVTQDAGPA